jgi:dephospho-CoA kinase
MVVIGLTGGIASGKSVVADEFAKLGIDIIDTDQIARDMVHPTQPAFKKIVDHFGQTILLPDGQLNRKKLKECIFSNVEEKQWLEQLLHPLIRQEVYQRLKQVSSPYCIVSIPLLIETLPHPYIHRILVVDAEPSRQQERLQKRDQLSSEQAGRIMASQATRAQRLAKADDLLENTGSIDALKEKVLALHHRYLNL